MAFESLTDRLAGVFKKLRGHGKLTEADIKAAMREVRMALLEADVSYKVVKDFVASVTEKCVGADVLDSLTPAQQIIKIVNEDFICREELASCILFTAENDGFRDSDAKLVSHRLDIFFIASASGHDRIAAQMAKLNQCICFAGTSDALDNFHVALTLQTSLLSHSISWSMVLGV